MKNYLIAIALGFLVLIPQSAKAQTTRNPCYTSQSVTAAGITNCIGVGTSTPLPVTNTPSGTQTISGAVTVGSYPTSATAITGNAAGSTGAVVGTLSGTAAKTTYICGFNVQSVGGAATSGPITVAGLVGSSQVYQAVVNGAAVAQVASQSFNPCIPASAVNTSITITTTANGTATAVDVNSWGYQQ